MAVGDELRRFSDENVQAQIDRALQTLPEDKRGAVVGYVDTEGEARLAVVGRLNHGWTYIGALSHQPSTGWKGEAAVRWAW